MNVIEIISKLLIISGAFFFLAGTVGLLRFPDVYTRLHALTKVDNLGLGFIIAGLLLTSDSLNYAIKLLVIWLLILLSGASICYLIASAALRSKILPWRMK
jgi:multicomponent Na+:H+ antiporter subunit G